MRTFTLIVIGMLIGCTAMAFALRYYDTLMARPYPDALTVGSWSHGIAESFEIQPTGPYFVRFDRGEKTLLTITRHSMPHVIIGTGTLTPTQIDTLIYWLNAQRSPTNAID